MAPLRRRILAVVLASAAFAASAEAQGTQGAITAPDLGDSGRQMVERLSGSGEHARALEAARELLADAPDDYRLRVLAAQEGLLSSFLAADADAVRGLLRESIEHAQRAMAREPLGERARYLNLAAHGRLGLLSSGPLERAQLAVVVDSAARSLLESNPGHAGAQNALGRLYMEVADLDWFSRIFARRLLGGDLVARATWQAAEEHLRAAADLEPSRNMHLVDLGALLVKRGRLDEARGVLQEAVRRPLETPAQEEFRREAERLLSDLGERRHGPQGP